MVTVRLPFCSTSTLSIGRERENKLKKKMRKKKREKKRLNCFRFFFGNMPPFPSFPHSWFPNPERSISSAPTPKSLPLGWGWGKRSRGRQSQGRENTQEDRDQERHGVMGLQAGRRTMPSDVSGHPHGRGESRLGGRLWLGGHQGGSGKGYTLIPSHPACCPPARTRGPGEGVQCLLGPGCPELREQAELLPSLCWPRRSPAGFPQALTTQKKPTQRKGDRVDTE